MAAGGPALRPGGRPAPRHALLVVHPAAGGWGEGAHLATRSGGRVATVTSPQARDTPATSHVTSTVYSTPSSRSGKVWEVVPSSTLALTTRLLEGVEGEVGCLVGPPPVVRRRV